MKKKGMDVSNHQGVIDWKKVKASGMEFAILRTGYGDVLANPNQIDQQFYNNRKGAAAVGIPVGVYHFSYAGTEAEAKTEAQGVLSLLRGFDMPYPVYFDYEYDSDRLTGRPGKEHLTDIAIAFLKEIQRAGYRAGVYLNLDFARNRYDMARLQPYEIWLAHYHSEPGYSCGMQQTTDKGTVPGISGFVDLDVAFQEYEMPAGSRPDVSWDTLAKQLNVGESYAALCTCRNDDRGANVRSDNPDVVEIISHHPRYTSRKGETGELYTIRGLKPGEAKLIASIPQQDSASFTVKVVPI